MNAPLYSASGIALDNATGHTAEIVASYVANNAVSATELPALITSVHAAIVGLGKTDGGTGGAPSVAKATPAEIKASVTRDALISFEDGKPYKTLRRHLTIRGLTPEAYRAKHGLPVDYPMTAQSYSDRRSELAHLLGLGQQRRKAPAPVKAV